MKKNYKKPSISNNKILATSNVVPAVLAAAVGSVAAAAASQAVKSFFEEDITQSLRLQSLKKVELL